ncbi:hypothetical protein FUAX_13190 [Fulvitalea axinellae]|uniref:DUF1569 domain-containing protein n=1 Tax=Fulvitalea axinellae TaxID=1182444 RepID=A0AAU9CTX8_9BACT|nr:hypothetical protein FUAX_13190 [Fulvitalea axinellae]
MPNSVFTEQGVNELTERIGVLTADSEKKWGKMDPAQMLAHCNVPYEMVYEDTHPRPNPLVRFFLKRFVKPAVVSDKPYPRNSRTAPQFLVKDKKDFEKEKAKLLGHIRRTAALGEVFFDGRESHSFGRLSLKEWDTMFYKHLDHHLKQFGA